MTCMKSYPPHSKLEAIRKSRGWKRSELARRSGVSHKHIYGIETGFNTVADETLQIIANALGVPIADIQETADVEPDDPSDAATQAGRPAEEVAA